MEENSGTAFFKNLIAIVVIFLCALVLIKFGIPILWEISIFFSFIFKLIFFISLIVAAIIALVMLFSWFIREFIS